jgi:Na+/glutamate symporter
MSKQTRAASLAESLANVAVSYVLSVAATAVVLPRMFGIFIPLSSNLAIRLIFTVISIARSFALRRLFEAFRVRGH